MPIFHQLAAGALIFRCALEWNRIVDRPARMGRSIEVHCNTGLFLRRTQSPRARGFRRRLAHYLHAGVDAEVSGHRLPAAREKQMEHPRLHCTQCHSMPFHSNAHHRRLRLRGMEHAMHERARIDHRSSSSKVALEQLLGHSLARAARRWGL